MIIKKMIGIAVLGTLMTSAAAIAQDEHAKGIYAEPGAIKWGPVPTIIAQGS